MSDYKKKLSVIFFHKKENYRKKIYFSFILSTIFLKMEYLIDTFLKKLQNCR